jgi:hypothetical protein
MSRTCNGCGRLFEAIDRGAVCTNCENKHERPVTTPLRKDFGYVFEEIFKRYPEAAKFDPCPCGRTLAIIKREHIKPWHYPIEDDYLRRCASDIIIRNKLPFTNEPDGVLVIAEIA